MKIEDLSRGNLAAQSNWRLYKELENRDCWALQMKDSSELHGSYDGDDTTTKKVSQWMMSKRTRINGGMEPQLKSKVVTFQSCMKLPLFIGQLVGLNSVRGILEDDTSKVRFSWKSWKVIYSTMMCFAQGAATWFCIKRLLNHSVTYSLIGKAYVWFYGSVFFSTALFFHVSMQWPVLIQEVVAAESFDPVTDSNLKFRCNVAAITSFTLALLEHIFAIISRSTDVFNCHSDSDDLYRTYIENSFPFLFECGFSYSLPLGIALQLFNFASTLNWSYADMFIICNSLYLESRFDQVNKKIIVAQEKILPSSFWRERRVEYNRVSLLVRSFNEVISGVIFVSFSINLFFICLQLFYTLKNGIGYTKPSLNCSTFHSGPMGGYERAVYLLFSTGLLMTRSLVTSLVVARVHSASLAPAPTLYSVPSPSYCTEVQRFINQIQGNPVALTGLNFFNVTRGVVLSVAGTIVTYELVLLQFETSNK